MDDVLDRALSEPAKAANAEDQSKGESQTQEQTAEKPEVTAEGNGATPATENTVTQVPLAALEAERKQRRDWKEQALIAKGELKALREQFQRPAEQQEAPPLDPVALNALRSESLFLDQSERAAVKEHGKELVDKAFEWFQQERAKNPALHNQVLGGADPYGEVVAMHKRHEAQAEIGEDPVAYRAKVRAEIEAELKGSVQPVKPVVLPKSLADARSSASRGTTWTGPTPLNAIL